MKGSTMDAAEPRKTPTWIVALAWVVVTIPLVWGVTMSVQKSLPLFMAAKPGAKVKG